MVILGLRLTTPGSVAAQAQDTVRTRDVTILGADLLQGSLENGLRVNRLVNARLQQGSTYLEADRAIEYEAAREYVFQGNVLIIDEGDTLSSEHVFYDADTKQGRARGSVRLSDGGIRVHAPSGLYFVDEKRAEFREGVRLVDSTAIVTSREGEYWSEEERGAFSGEVTLRETDTFLASDSLVVYRKTRESLARGDVFIRRFGTEEEPSGGEPGAVDQDGRAAVRDTSVVTYLIGDEAYSDDLRKISRVSGNPVVMQIRTDSTGATDTTVVRAREIEISRLDSLDRLIGVDSVRIWQESFAARADSVVYDRVQRGDSTFSETMQLLRAPTAWFEDSQIYGDTLRVVARGGGVDTLFVEGRAFAAQRDSTLDRINQLSGRRMVGIFEDDSLRVLNVGPNARAIRYLADEAGALSQGIQLSGDNAVIRLLGEERTHVAFGRDTEGTAYPLDQIPTPFELEGFRWNPDQRPTLRGLVDPAIIADRAVRAREPMVEILPQAEP